MRCLHAPKTGLVDVILGVLLIGSSGLRDSN
jgi:hypothetical protein